MTEKQRKTYNVLGDEYGEKSKSSGRQRDLSCDAARDKGQRIFEDDEDRERFLEILKKSKEKDGFDLIAWA